ncbi:MAG TPA: 6-phosphogluconolactonase [Steroidobacteraceae bacterium]|nr:6-phosphogluconolactonase [Steroidobacteraceae bacterium]
MLLKRSESIDAAARALAEEICAALRDALRARGMASLLVPGGRTPVPLFRLLRRCDLQWRDIVIGLTDERWVPQDQAGSNARLVRTELLTGAASAARFVPLHNPASSAMQGAADCWRAMASIPRPYDAVVLGMGEDGHFASLFPDSPGIAGALDVGAGAGCVPMRATSAPVDRVSLNLAALADTRRLFLFITGGRKLELVESAVARAGLPIDALLALRDPQPVVFWAP